uniref:Glutaredoxin 5 n=1 Tax=Bubo bubo TaxID=30461 RepID=A0A8C0EIB7_BUBBB
KDTSLLCSLKFAIWAFMPLVEKFQAFFSDSVPVICINFCLNGKEMKILVVLSGGSNVFCLKYYTICRGGETFNTFLIFFFSYAGIKNYSNWPTIPQVYLNGEFVGGCDILLQMHQNGDLVEELKKLGIRSALLDAEKDQDKK